MRGRTDKAIMPFIPKIGVSLSLIIPKGEPWCKNKVFPCNGEVMGSNCGNNLFDCEGKVRLRRANPPRPCMALMHWVVTCHYLSWKGILVTFHRG